MVFIDIMSGGRAAAYLNSTFAVEKLLTTAKPPRFSEVVLIPDAITTAEGRTMGGAESVDRR